MEENVEWSPAIRLSDNGDWAAIGKGRQLNIWDVKKRTIKDSQERHDNMITDMAFVEDGDQFVVLSTGLDDQISTGYGIIDQPKRFQSSGGITSIAVSPGKEWIATGSYNNKVTIYNPLDPEITYNLTHFGKTKSWLAICLDGTFRCSPELLRHLLVLDGNGVTPLIGK